MSAAAPQEVRIGVDLETEILTPGRLALCVAVADHLDATEELTVTGPGGPLATEPVAMPHGTRLHVLEAPAGQLTVHYDATVRLGAVPEAEVTTTDRLRYVYPSRYCPSDTLAGWATGQFGTGPDEQRVLDVVEWVSTRTAYTPGTTGPTDDALVPLLTAQGVCRDYAHLVITVLRGLDIPARYVSVYAPGLDPMDAHAVVEAAVDGVWRVVDATRLAPRLSMVRAGTGRDATEVALMTTLGAATGPPLLTVTTTAQPDLPPEDPAALVTLG